MLVIAARPILRRRLRDVQFGLRAATRRAGVRSGMGGPAARAHALAYPGSAPSFLGQRRLRPRSAGRRSSRAGDRAWCPGCTSLKPKPPSETPFSRRGASRRRRRCWRCPYNVERAPSALHDLRALPESPLVLAEGSPLPAQAVSIGIADHSTCDFQRALLAARGTPPGPAALCLPASGHDRARGEEHGAPTLIVDRGFICECGDCSCDATLHVPLGALSSEPLLARGHR
jgi:hypothetical protein